MSSAVVSTSAASGRPFLFDDDPDSGGAPFLAAIAGSRQVAAALEDLKKPAGKQSAAAEFVQSTINNQQSTILQASVIPASRLEIRPPEMAYSGIPALDSLTGGLPRGCLTEICGPASSGRTSVLLAALAAATSRGEFCAVIDASDALDPHSAAAAGIDLDRFLWVRCGHDSPRKHGHEASACREMGAPDENGAPDALVRGPRASRRTSDESEQRLEQVLRATDLLLESGGFGLIILDLADVPSYSARRIALATWFRFRRAVEHKSTILLAIGQQPIAGSCSSMVLQLATQKLSKEKRSEQKFSGERSATDKFLQHAMLYDSPDSSREAAAFISPARGCRVDSAIGNESQRDDTSADGLDTKPPSSCARLDNRGRLSLHESVTPTHAHLLSGLQIHVERIRSRLDRKPAHSAMFETKTAWAGINVMNPRLPDYKIT